MKYPKKDLGLKDLDLFGAQKTVGEVVVALAQDLGAPLVTFDREVLEKFPHVAIHVETFLS